MDAKIPPQGVIIASEFTILQDVEAIVRHNAPSERIDDAIRRAELAVERANAFGFFPRPPEHVRKQLEDRLGAIKREARHRLLDNVPGLSKPLRDGQKSVTAEHVVDWFSAAAARRNAPTVIRALESSDHWLSKRYENRLLTLVQGHDAVPDGHRKRLDVDMATILRRFPAAAGLVKRLTVQDQRGSTEAQPVRNAHSAIGGAYELIATASLIRSGSRPVNAGAPMLHTSGLDYTTACPQNPPLRLASRIVRPPKASTSPASIASASHSRRVGSP